MWQEPCIISLVDGLALGVTRALEITVLCGLADRQAVVMGGWASTLADK